MDFDNTVHFPPYYDSPFYVSCITPTVWGDIMPFVAIFNEILQLYAYVYVVIW
jgi:hypothetical protein